MREDEQVQIRHHIKHGETVWLPLTREEAQLVNSLLYRRIWGESAQRDLLSRVGRRLRARLDPDRGQELKAFGAVVFDDPEGQTADDKRMVDRWKKTPIGEWT